MDKNSVLAERLAQIGQLSREVAANSRTDVNELLEILRTLELLHREIRDELFQNALPADRHNLYRLLRDIEENGGWPYIARLRLQHLLVNLPSFEESMAETNPDNCPIPEP
jgi:hypothetical protein